MFLISYPGNETTTSFYNGINKQAELPAFPPGILISPREIFPSLTTYLSPLLRFSFLFSSIKYSIFRKTNRFGYAN